MDDWSFKVFLACCINISCMFKQLSYSVNGKSFICTTENTDRSAELSKLWSPHEEKNKSIEYLKKLLTKSLNTKNILSFFGWCIIKFCFILLLKSLFWESFLILCFYINLSILDKRKQKEIRKVPKETTQPPVRCTHVKYWLARDCRALSRDG